MRPGEVLLGKYRVERVLGQGGMGIVVAARHVHLGELFAIKMLIPSALSHPDSIERFLREARASAKLKGEHVARVHDVGSLENGAPYMLMEHLAGADLKQLVRSRGGLPVDEAALYVYHACEAVAEAHANGIVHRDLKPANLFLIRRPNGTPCVKVLDFGISKELDPNNNTGSDLTKTGAFMGSPLYMSPEQMANIKATDMRSDIWALGVILYELTTGKVPFTAEAVTELVTKVLVMAPIPPSHVRSDIPLAFDAIILKCLEKRPENRFQSVRELMGQLLPFMSGSFPHTVVGTALPMVPARLEMASFPSTVVMGGTPIGETNPAVSECDPGQASKLTEQILSPAQSSLTSGAWGNTSKGAARKKDTITLALVGAGFGLVALIGVAFVATRPNRTTSGSRAEPTAATLPEVTPLAAVSQAAPIAVPTTVPPEPLPQASRAIAEPSIAPLGEPNATTTRPVQEQKPPQPKTTTGPVPSKPVNPRATKSSVAGFDE